MKKFIKLKRKLQTCHYFVKYLYGKFMLKQLSEYFESILSTYQCGFRKGLEWNLAIDNRNTFGSVLPDLLKEFNLA